MVRVKETAEPHFREYPQDEFVKYLGDVFQISYASRFTHKQNSYSYFILKPYSRPSERYGIGEIIAIYAPYREIQGRTIDALIELQQTEHKNRVHQVWNIIITDNETPIENLEALTRDKEIEVYSIPFSRLELENKPPAKVIYDRLERFIQGRDLFDAQSALRSKLFFFGRDDLLSKLISSVEKGQNFGLFGLRKTGKTSLLYALEMYLERLGTYTIIHIDCQGPAIYLKKWEALLAYIYKQLSGKTLEFNNSALIAQNFENEIKVHPKKILIVFDEVENISFAGLSPAKHWNEDFLPFWGTLRSSHQSGKMTVGVAGVNPFIFEVPLVKGVDNPFLLGISKIDLGFLDELSIKKMVKSIGRYMGLEIDNKVYPWLYTQYGGHPLLTRKACSLVYNKARKSSGDTLEYIDFESRQNWLDEQLGRDVLNILVVLMQHYPSEFNHLMEIAKGDISLYKFLKNEPEYAQELAHIMGYNIIKDKNNEPIFVIQALQRFLITSGLQALKAVEQLTIGTNPTSYDIIPQPNQLDLWTRNMLARNQVEPKLRQIILKALLFKFGEKKARERVLLCFDDSRRPKFDGYNINEIFSDESKLLYLLDLKNLVSKNWELFQHVFDNDKKAFMMRIDKLNTDGRLDAHANKITEKGVIQVETVADELLNQMSPFFN